LPYRADTQRAAANDAYSNLDGHPDFNCKSVPDANYPAGSYADTI
jgi:hypothetical protein